MVRLSGSGTREVLASVLSDRPPQFERGCFRSRFKLDDRRALPVLAAVFRAPASYTGEDSAEILFAGNPGLAERILARLAACEGVRLAGPGEFSARAYLNERLSLEQAEGVAAVIAAQNGEQLAAATELLEGSTGREYRHWADELTTLLALVEAGIDFTDQEDVVPIAPGELARRIGALMHEMGRRVGGPGAAASDGHLPRVVLVGRPNAGKSTLFNAMLGRERAVVSSIAGTTRDVLEEELDLSGVLPGAGSVMLVDVAGLDDAVSPGIGADAQAAALGAAAKADVVVHCDPDGRFAEISGVAAKPVIRVRTKADLPAARPDDGDVAVCALDGWHLGVLGRAIADASCGSRGDGLSAVLPRHRRALLRAGESLRDAAEAFAAADHRLGEPELVAGALRQALDAMEELVGRISPDDVIGRVFATFCVGK